MDFPNSDYILNIVLLWKDADLWLKSTYFKLTMFTVTYYYLFYMHLKHIRLNTNLAMGLSSLLPPTVVLKYSSSLILRVGEPRAVEDIAQRS